MTLELENPGRICSQPSCGARFWPQKGDKRDYRQCPECRRIWRLKMRHHRRRLRLRNLCIQCGRVRVSGKGSPRCAKCRAATRKGVEAIRTVQTRREKTDALIAAVLALPYGERSRLMRAIENVERQEFAKWLED